MICILTYIIDVEEIGIVVALRGSLSTYPVQLVCQSTIRYSW